MPRVRRYFYDTEFIEDGETIELISIGVVSDDGREFYAVSTEFDPNRAGPWVKRNVLTQLPSHSSSAWMPRNEIRDQLYEFLIVDSDPIELYAWYGAYDHVALGQLWGPIADVPRELPPYTVDLRQDWETFGRPLIPAQAEGQHDALADARHNLVRWQAIEAAKRRTFIPRVRRYFYDTKFVEDGKKIDLISIGVVDETGREFYAVSTEFDQDVAGTWVERNALTQLPPTGSSAWMTRSEIRDRLYEFLVVDSTPIELSAWCGAYDHVAFCQLWGRMIDLPRELPRYTVDLRQDWETFGQPLIPAQTEGLHDALAGARHNVVRSQVIQESKQRMMSR